MDQEDIVINKFMILSNNNQKCLTIQFQMMKIEIIEESAWFKRSRLNFVDFGSVGRKIAKKRNVEFGKLKNQWILNEGRFWENF